MTITSFQIFSASSGYAQLIKILVVADDADPRSLHRHNIIHRRVRNAWISVLASPAHFGLLKKSGLATVHVYDETGISLRFYGTSKKRRLREEVITLAEQINNPRIDVLVTYSIYANAFELVNGLNGIRTSFTYSAIDVRSKRIYSSDIEDLTEVQSEYNRCDFTDFDSRTFCVQRFIAQPLEKAARRAANRLIIDLGQLLASSYR